MLRADVWVLSGCWFNLQLRGQEPCYTLQKTGCVSWSEDLGHILIDSGDDGGGEDGGKDSSDCGSYDVNPFLLLIPYFLVFSFLSS